MSKSSMSWRNINNRYFWNNEILVCFYLLGINSLLVLFAHVFCILFLFTKLVSHWIPDYRVLIYIYIYIYIYINVWLYILTILNSWPSSTPFVWLERPKNDVFRGYGLYTRYFWNQHRLKIDQKQLVMFISSKFAFTPFFLGLIWTSF